MCRVKKPGSKSSVGAVVEGTSSKMGGQVVKRSGRIKGSDPAVTQSGQTWYQSGQMQDCNAGVHTRRGDKRRALHHGKARGPVWSNPRLPPQAQRATRHITPHTRSNPPSPSPPPRLTPHRSRPRTVTPHPSPPTLCRRPGGRPCTRLHATSRRRPWRR